MARLRSVLSASLVAVLVAVTSLGAPSRADASFKLQISTDGGTSFSPSLTATGSEFPIGSGAWSLDPSGYAFTDPAIADLLIYGNGFTAADLSTLDLMVLGTVKANQDLVIQLTFTDLVTPGPQNWSLVYTDTNATQATAEAWISRNNAEFGAQDFTSGTVNPTLDPLADNQTFTGSFAAGQPYSLTIQLHIVTGASDGSFGADVLAEIAPAPAPSGLVLLAGGAPFLSLVSARLRRRLPASA